MSSTIQDSSIYLPLVSNSSWFESESSFEKLDRFLKTVIAVHERIVVENGRIHLSAGDDGQGMCVSHPGNSFPGDRTEFKPYVKGNHFGVTFGNVSLLNSKTAYSVDIDYMPVLNRAGLSNAPFIEWSNHVFQGQTKQITSQLGEGFKKLILDDELQPFERYFHGEVAKQYANSALLAYALKLPICIDSVTSRIASKISQAELMKMQPTPINFSVNSIPMLNVPDFGDWTWDDIVRFRDSASGIEFRKMLVRVGEGVREAIAGGASVADVQRMSDIRMGQAISDELAKRRSSIAGLAISTLLNFVPYGGLISGALEAKDVWNDRSSWISIIGKAKD